MGADKNVGDPGGTWRLSEDRQCGGNDLTGRDGKLGPLEPGSSVDRPPVGDDMAWPVRRDGHQSLKANRGTSDERHNRCERRVVTQVTLPGKWPFEE